MCHQSKMASTLDEPSSSPTTKMRRKLAIALHPTPKDQIQDAAAKAGAAHEGMKLSPGREQAQRESTVGQKLARKRQGHAGKAVGRNLLTGNSLRLAMGMSCPGTNCFAVNPDTGIAIFPASGVIVLMSTLSCKQVGYIQASKLGISFLGFSPDGQYILVGEYGYTPSLRVWSMAHDQQVAQFQGHEYGVAFAAFSGKMDLVVSVGTNHDGTIFVWAWPTGERLSCNRFAEVIHAMSFSTSDPFFVTCGIHHIRFWYPERAPKRPLPECKALNTLLGRSVIMQDMKTRVYMDVAIGSGPSGKFVYCVTSCGLVCKINSDRQVSQFHQLMKNELSSVQVSDHQLVTASVMGHIHFFDAISMQYMATVCMPVNAIGYGHKIGGRCPDGGDHPRTYASNNHDAPAGGGGGGGGTADASVPSPTTAAQRKVCLGLDIRHHLLSAVFDNGNLCIWDIENVQFIKRRYFTFTHNNQISGFDVDLTAKLDAKGKLKLFSTCQDGMVRQWRLTMAAITTGRTDARFCTGANHSRDQLTCDAEVISVLKASPQLGLVVIGDSKGSVTVYDDQSLAVLCKIHDHVRSVSVILLYSTTGVRRDTQLMLTGARDRMIRVYTLRKEFQLAHSLCLHSGSISALAMLDEASHFVLLSSALDRTVVMSTMSLEEAYHFTPRQCRHTTSSVMDIHVCRNSHWAVLARANALLTVVDTRSFKGLFTFRACADPRGTLEKVSLDASGAMLVTACSDRSINVMSVPLGLRLACFTGHASPVNGLVVCANMRYLISSSRDGCILVWSLPVRTKRRAVYLMKQGTNCGHRRGLARSNAWALHKL